MSREPTPEERAYVEGIEYPEPVDPFWVEGDERVGRWLVDLADAVPDYVEGCYRVRWQAVRTAKARVHFVFEIGATFIVFRVPPERRR